MTSRRTAISCRRCGAPGRWYLGGRLCPRHAPGGPDGEVMRAFPDYTGRIPQVNGTINAGHTTAQAVRLLVEATIHVAMDVAYGRATEPESFPIVPATGVAEWYARRLLGDLLDAGFMPDGWETAYVEDAPKWGDPWSRESAD